MDGFDQVPHGDLDAVKKAIGPHTAGILIEPVQGEGGVRSAPHSFFKALRELCDQHGLLLAFDEVQTGMGRCGDLFAYRRIGVTPDVMSLAKALGGGFPIGAVLASAEAAAGMAPGSHGSTFGGNPLAVAAANAVLDVMLKPGFFDHVQKMSLLLKQKLASVVDRYPSVLVAKCAARACWSASRPWCLPAISWRRCAAKSCSPSAPATMSCASSAA